MSLGNSLLNARRKNAMTQAAVAEKLGVRRQTISKWEMNESMPNIRQSKQLSLIYHMTLDELIDFGMEEKELEDTDKNAGEKHRRK